MIEVDVGEDRLAVVDAEKNEVVIRTGGWEPTATAPRLDRRVDEAVSGATRWLEFPESAVTIDWASADQWTTFNESRGNLALPEESYVIQLESRIGVYVAFNGNASIIRSTMDGSVQIIFNSLTDLTLGFRSLITRPRHNITVPPTIEGVASALRYLSSAFEADSPDKTYPTLRSHPPSINFGDRIEIPREVYHEAMFSGVRLRIPSSIEYLLVTAPLIYYLNADIELSDSDSVEILSSELDCEYKLESGNQFEVDVANLLHRLFYLDCLVRNAGPYRTSMEEMDLANQLGLDLEYLYRQSTDTRLARYLEVDYDRIQDSLPNWHLSTVVTPEIDNIRILPYVLDRLSLIQIPRPKLLDRASVVSDSVQLAFHPSSRGYEPRTSSRLVQNETRLGRVQGWLAEGFPIDAFRPTIASFENQFSYHEHRVGDRSVLVVINDEKMLPERDAVESIYNNKANELAMEVNIQESLTRDELRDYLISGVDFLHYIGHCDQFGLKCIDGSISIWDVENTRVQTFFLNACNSFHQGLAMVSSGSVAGAVTYHNVLNPEATIVGTTFARLIMHGFNIEHSLRLASRLSLTSKLYGVVGVGTHQISQSNQAYPSIYEAKTLRDGMIEVTAEGFCPTLAGAVIVHNIDDSPHYHLSGTQYSRALTDDQFNKFLRICEDPIILDNRFYWPEELLDQLAT